MLTNEETLAFDIHFVNEVSADRLSMFTTEKRYKTTPAAIWTITVFYSDILKDRYYKTVTTTYQHTQRLQS